MEFRSLADLAPYDDILDVRSPAEFAEDRVPGATSMPVLTNAERAEVGTLYAADTFEARKLGAPLILMNLARALTGPYRDRPPGWRPLIYCWRGGQRSGSVALIMQKIGWRAEVIEGGYRAYRRRVQARLYETPLPWRLVVLDGNTGTAKTALLSQVAAAGGQMVDLEGLAAHRGSAFGALPGRPQPSQKGFESALMAALEPLDPARPVLVEGESARIGDLRLPPKLWQAMGAAPRIVVTAPVAERAAHSLAAYPDILADPARLTDTLEMLVPLRGREAVARWRDLARDGAHRALAEALIAEHYDPAYAAARARARRGPETPFALARLDPASLAAAAPRLIELASRCLDRGDGPARGP